MAANVTLQNTIDFCRPFVNWANLNIGTNNEPAFTAANLALQTIMGPPFVWPWNRSTVKFLTTQGVQDYNVATPFLGFVETATVQRAAVITNVTVVGNVATYTAINGFSSLPNGGVGATVTITGCTTSAYNGTFQLASVTGTQFTINITTPNNNENESGAQAIGGPIMPLEIKWGSQTEASEQDRPTFISTQTGTESGVSFVFRLLPVPDTTYQIILNYQQAPVPFAHLSDTWGIPDQYQYIYTFFFLFLMLDYFDDTRAPRYRQLAIASLLSRQAGLSETDKNLFLGNWLPLVTQEEQNTGTTQQATQAKGY